MSIKNEYLRLNRVEDIAEQIGGAQRMLGISAVIITQILDVIITVHALTISGVVELNPIALAAINAFGTIRGLLLLSLIAVLMVSLVTEFAAAYCTSSNFPAVYMRLLGYLPMTAVSVVAISYNMSLLISLSG